MVLCAICVEPDGIPVAVKFVNTIDLAWKARKFAGHLRMGRQSQVIVRNLPSDSCESVYCFSMQVVVEIPDEFVSALAPSGGDLPRQLLEDRVAQLYRDGSLTTAEVRRVLGFSSRFEVEPFLAKYGIVDYTLDEFREDMKTLERLRQRA